jgi:cAMP-dependent protein kinase regulator
LEEDIHSQSEDDDTEDFDEVQELEMKNKLKNLKPKRSSVCAEVYGFHNKKEDFIAKIVPKTSDQIERITNKVNQSFMFSALDERELKTVIDAMEEKIFQKDDVVIKQGDDGDVLYLLETGKLDCFKRFNNDEKDTFLKSYLPGEAFGELALLYNAPRAATIIATENCKMWSLDRATFNHIVKDASMKKREMYEKFLRSVEILKSIDSYEINQISDALKCRKYKAGEKIIKKDDIGEEFYMLEQGSACATKCLAGCKIIKYKYLFLSCFYFCFVLFLFCFIFILFFFFSD